jgi:hypothetical protein
LRRFFTIFFLLIIILGSGYSIYYYWDKQKSLDAWSLVPENTLFVYENNNLIKTWNSLQENPIWNDLLNIPELRTIKKKFEKLDSLAGGNGVLDELSRNNRVLISIHPTAKDDFDFVFYQGLHNSEQINIVSAIREKFSSLKLNTRQYEDFNINELKNDENQVVFSYIILRGNFVGSYSPILVEDVIRNLQKKEEGFRKKNEDIFKIAKFQNDAGNFFINFNRLNKFIKLFTNNDISPELISILGKFSGSTFLDLIIDQHDFYFNGYTFLNDSNAYLKIFDKQKGGELTIKNYIPSRTATLIHQRFDNAESWMNATTHFWSNTSENYELTRTQLSQKYKTDFTTFHHFMSGEIALATMNSIASQDENEKLLYIKLRDKNEGLSEFNKLAEEAALSNNDTLYYEFYANQEIRELAIDEFPKWLFGPNYEGFSTTYFTLMDDLLILSNSIQALKNLELDIEKENTWGKSIKFNQFIESSLKEANLNVFINLNQAWPMLLPNLNEKWNKNFIENQLTINNLDLIALQFSQEQNRFYTNLTVRHQEKEKLNRLSQYTSLASIQMSNKLIHKPFVVKNYQTGLFETLIQDSSYQLNLISNNGTILWAKDLEAPIISDVYQIDYFKNNKLQYAFATTRNIHLIDRNGQELAQYPRHLNEHEEIAYFNVIDYDKSKNYRMLFATKMGDIYLTNKEGKELGQWSPLKLGDQLVTMPQHIRIRSKDFMVALQQNGEVNVMSRNGDMKPNFPVGLDDRLTNNLFFEIGNTFEKSRIVTLTTGGKLVKVSFTGKIEHQVQMYKPTKETIFKIIPDAINRHYIIARQDLNRVSILNAKGELLFDKDYISQKEMRIQYYQFTENKELIAITDIAQQFTYLYTMDGTLINSQPIESDHEVAIIYYSKENAIHIYKNYESTFEILKLKF